MKMFTIDEANQTLQIAKPFLLEIQFLHRQVIEFKEFAKKAAGCSNFGGGIEGGTIYIKSIYKLGELSAKITELGIQIKDFSRGLIDFPCMRAGEVVLLCWQIGEGDEIEWWHEIEAGFQGRQKL